MKSFIELLFMTFFVTLLGVRGSTPRSDVGYMEYGGHTSCIMIEVENSLFFFDAGSGIINANDYIAQKKFQEINLLFSHVHLDHVLGLPFFKPMWQKDIKTNIYAGNLKAYGGMYQFLAKTFCPPLFPIPFEKMPGDIHCHDFEPGATFSFDKNIQVETALLNHPNGAVGYRLMYQEKSICYVTDTEHMPAGLDDNILGLIQGTEVFIYDATFSDDNYSDFKGWGHSTWQEAIRLGEKSKVKKTIIFHHDPYSSDKNLAAIEEIIQKNHYKTDVIIAKQGMCLHL